MALVLAYSASLHLLLVVPLVFATLQLANPSLRQATLDADLVCFRGQLLTAP